MNNYTFAIGLKLHQPVMLRLVQYITEWDVRIYCFLIVSLIDQISSVVLGIMDQNGYLGLSCWVLCILRDRVQYLSQWLIYPEAW